MRKQTQAQIIGREGERWFKSILPSEWSEQRPIDDFGTDGIIAIGDANSLTSLEFGVQIKSTQHLKLRDDKIIAPKVSSEEVEYWLSKFYPTLLVIYDAKNRHGYFEWVNNLVPQTENFAEKKNHHFQIEKCRMFSETCWALIRAELQSYDRDFREAITAKFEILPLVSSLSFHQSSLCWSETIDLDAGGGREKYVISQFWTHILVVKKLNELLVGLNENNPLRRPLLLLKKNYSTICSEIIQNFDELITSDGPGWIIAQKPEKCRAQLFELTSMLADCIYSLLKLAEEK